MVKKIKQKLQTPRGWLILCILLGVLFLVGWVATSTESSTRNIRDIVLEIRGMAFAGNNPDIHIYPGETVRFIIHNLDPGMKHNFTITETNLSTRLLNYGEKETILFTPPTEGQWVYFCAPHAARMRGILQVSRELVKKLF